MNHKQLSIAIFHDLAPSGAKRALFHLTKLLAQHGHRLDLYTLSSADETYLPLTPFIERTIIEQAAPQLRIVPSRIPLVDQTRNVWRRLRYLNAVDQVHQQLAQRINANSYDLAFVHNCMETHIPNLLRHLHLPGVYFCHEPLRRLHEPPMTWDDISFSCCPSANHESMTSTFLRKLEGMWYAFSEPLYKRKYRENELNNVSAATLLLANSYYSREVIYKTYGIFPKVNYLGVDTELFRPIPIIAKEPIVLSVGGLEPSKQHHLVIKSVGQLPKFLRPNVVIIGWGANIQYRNDILQLAQELEVSLRLLSSVSEDELVLWYNKAQVVVFVPLMEPFGLVSLEAMACGTPIIGVKEGGIREVVLHKETGLLVERDLRDISEAILRILQDDTYAEKLGKQGREYVCEQWTWEKSYQQLIKHFESVLR